MALYRNNEILGSLLSVQAWYLASIKAVCAEGQYLRNNKRNSFHVLQDFQGWGGGRGDSLCPALQLKEEIERILFPWPQVQWYLCTTPICWKAMQICLSSEKLDCQNLSYLAWAFLCSAKGDQEILKLEPGASQVLPLIRKGRKETNQELFLKAN